MSNIAYTEEHWDADEVADPPPSSPAASETPDSSPRQNSTSEPEPGPIYGLPEEVLSLILNILHDTIVHDDPDRPQARIRTASIASQVSSFWRFVALQNPLWWTYIFIAPPWKFEPIITYLERSKNCPLDIRVSVHQNQAALRDEGLEQASLDGYQRLETVLFPHLHRCRSLVIQGFFRNDLQFLPFLTEPLQTMDMPHLEEFTLDGDFQNDTEDHQLLFKSAPRLLDVRLGGLGILSYTPPFSTITELHLSRATDNHHLSFHKLRDVLVSCKRLTTFAVYDDLLCRDGAELTCSVPHLESVYILGNMLSVSELLLFLDAPKLRELVIAPVIGGDFTNLLLFNAQRKNGSETLFPTLTNLTLAPAFSDAFKDTLPSASECFPKVQTLIFANIYYPEFSEAFTQPQADHPFPNLQELALTDINKLMIKEVREVVDFRAAHGFPLKTVYLDSESMAKLEDVDHGFWDGINVQVADLWEAQRRKAMYRNMKDLFVGRRADDD